MSLGHRLVPALALVLTLGACTGADDPSPAESTSTSVSPWPTPATTWPSASASPSPTPSPGEGPSFPPPPADETEDEAAVRGGWQAYWEAFDHALKTPGSDLSALESTTTGEMTTLVPNTIAAWHDNNLKPTGTFILRDVRVAGLGTDSPTVAYCVDTSRLRPVKLDTGEPAEGEIHSTMSETVNMERPANSEVWLVASIRNEAESC